MSLESESWLLERAQLRLREGQEDARRFLEKAPGKGDRDVWVMTNALLIEIGHTLVLLGGVLRAIEYSKAWRADDSTA